MPSKPSMERVVWSSNIPACRIRGRLFTLPTDRNNWLSAGLTICLSEKESHLEDRQRVSLTKSSADGSFPAHRIILLEGRSVSLPGPLFRLPMRSGQTVYPA